MYTLVQISLLVVSLYSLLIFNVFPFHLGTFLTAHPLNGFEQFMS